MVRKNYILYIEHEMEENIMDMNRLKVNEDEVLRDLTKEKTDSKWDRYIKTKNEQQAAEKFFDEVETEEKEDANE